MVEEVPNSRRNYPAVRTGIKVRPHRVGLARARLTVRKDGEVVALQELVAYRILKDRLVNVSC